MTKVYALTRAAIVAQKVDWNKVEAVAIDEYQWLGEAPIRASARVCYDESGLYARLEAEEQNILARFKGTYDMVCLDSCLELFLRPVEDDIRYFNFEFNPNGAMYLGFGHDRFDSVRQIVQNPKQLFRVAPFEHNGGWGIEFFIPVSFLQLYFPGYLFKSGNIILGNFYKCGDETNRPHYISWNKVQSETPDFHLPEQFGKWILK